MIIYIPTYERAHDQRTFNNLPATLQRNVVFVIQPSERKSFADKRHLVLPARIKTIAPTRQWILDNHQGESVFVMADDDLHIDTRRSDDLGKFRKSNPGDVKALFDKIQRSLKKYAHVSVISRQGANRYINGDIECGRAMKLMAFNADILRKEKVRFDRIECQEDFDVTLQLLRKGYKNLIIASHCVGDYSTGSEGGCSHFRTLALQEKTSIQLARMHDPFVKLVQKTTKGAWGGGTRTDVIVQWKKAYASSQNAD